jgi:hypothetical protein
MKPQSWITGWLKPWDQILHGCKIIAAKNMGSVIASLMSALSVLSVSSVSSVVNLFTNEFSPGSPGEVGLNT